MPNIHCTAAVPSRFPVVPSPRVRVQSPIITSPFLAAATLNHIKNHQNMDNTSTTTKNDIYEVSYIFSNLKDILRKARSKLDASELLRPYTQQSTSQLRSNTPLFEWNTMLVLAGSGLWHGAFSTQEKGKTFFENVGWPMRRKPVLTPYSMDDHGTTLSQLRIRLMHTSKMTLQYLNAKWIAAVNILAILDPFFQAEQ